MGVLHFLLKLQSILPAPFQTLQLNSTELLSRIFTFRPFRIMQKALLLNLNDHNDFEDEGRIMQQDRGIIWET
jgi:hypothetical protein